VVAFFRLFQKRQVGLERLFVEEGRAVDTLELGLALVGPPVCAGDRISLKALTKPVWGTWGPRHRSVKFALLVKGLMVPSSRSPIISSL
jgi:hypothetical protein